MQPSEEIKSRLDIVEVLRDYIQLKQAGANWRALCPFHREKTPSFMVSQEKQIWHCFGCGEGGDIFSFVMKIEGIEFVDALRLLAPKAGVTLKRSDPKLTSKRNRLLDILEASSGLYHKILLENGRAEAARNYLKDRGLRHETIAGWRIGYSPDDWESAFKFLRSRSFTEEEIFAAGMIVKRNDKPGYYDRFRGRIMFPICDTAGNVVAFSARVSPDKEATEKMGKYINSPQTMIYDKSRVLFGLDKAKVDIKQKDLVIVVEGQMDAVTAHQNGYKNTVASSSTSLSEEHLKLIKRYTGNIAFALDADAAGQLGVARGSDLIEERRSVVTEAEDSSGRMRQFIDRGLSHGMNVTLIEIPEGKDPDECIRGNPELWRKAVTDRKPLMERYFSTALEGIDTDDLTGRRRIAKILLPKIAKLGDQIERDLWIKKLSERIDVSENVLRETLRRYMTKNRISHTDQSVANTGAMRTAMSRGEKLSELLLAFILKFPALIEYVLNRIELVYIQGEKNLSLYKNLTVYYNKFIENSSGPDGYGTPDWGGFFEEFKQWLNEELINVSQNPANHDSTSKEVNQLRLLDRLVLLSEKDYSDFDTEQSRSEITAIIKSLKERYLISRKKEIEKLIAESEKQHDEARTTILLEELKILDEDLINSNKS